MTVRHSFDSERILGQIERGEIACGPDAARRIAARAMEAYGNAVWGGTPAVPAPAAAPVPSSDEEWADALAELGGEAR